MITKIALVEMRTTEGWPAGITFEFDDGWPLTIQLTHQSQYSRVADVVKLLNEQLGLKP